MLPTNSTVSAESRCRQHEAWHVQPVVWLCLLAVVFAVSACGFKLRGAISLSGEVAPVAIERNGAFDLGRDIRQILETNNVAYSEKASSAKSVITLKSESRDRRLLSVDNRGQASEYRLIYKVEYSLRSKGAPEKSYTASQQKSLVFDPGAVLAVEKESEVLYREMRRDVARLILIRLEAHAAGAKTR